MSVEKTPSGTSNPVAGGAESKSSSETARKVEVALSNMNPAAPARMQPSNRVWSAFLESTGSVGKAGGKEEYGSLEWASPDDVEISSAYDRPSGRRFLVLGLHSGGS